MKRRDFLLASISLVGASALRAEPAKVISAQEAHERVRAGEIVLIDIRTPKEWAASGVAEGAWPIDMVSRDFGARMTRLLKAEADKPIAIICATGGRTLFLQKLIAENGLGEVLDVGEGMFGSRHGGGWLKAKLPVVSAQDALKALPEAYRAGG